MNKMMKAVGQEQLLSGKGSPGVNGTAEIHGRMDSHRWALLCEVKAAAFTFDTAFFRR